METTMNVLDHGFVRLVSYMQPVPNSEHREAFGTSFEKVSMIGRDPASWTGDLEIVRNARVSFDADWRMDGKLEHKPTCLSLVSSLYDCDCSPVERNDAKLINYLWSNRHTSPFEAMVFTFEVKAPIFIFRQWHRHRTWSYNEISARYGELPAEFYVPLPNMIGEADPKNKQSRMIKEMVERDRVERLVEGIRTKCAEMHAYYRSLLNEGVPREVARAVLPLNTYSRMFATVDLNNLFHFLSLRLHPHAQYEIRVYAAAMLKLIQPIVPEAVAAFLAKHEVVPLS